ncbi:MAG: EAL domain-containing protein [Pyrinomonadaceae bacterium]|nr:EAL domain-containing protein [Pyrinomonadaceae bacterium]
MERNQILDHIKVIVIGVGILATGLSLFTLPADSFGWGYVLLMSFAILIAPRMSLTLPRSKFSISFSDSIVFLAFLVYGGEMAIFTAFVETLANCLYLKHKGRLTGRWIVPFNSSLAAVVTAISYGVLIASSLLPAFEKNKSDTRALVTVMGLFALTQFFGSSILVSVYQNIKSRAGIWQIWKTQGLSSSLTQFTGAALAGMVFKLINYADVLVTGIACVGLILMYVSYRQSIGEINDAIDQVEEAERQKSELERERRREAEKHADQLKITLEKEENANIALRKSERDFQHAALHDSLTRLPNRKHLGDMLRGLINDYRRDPSESFHVLFLDISRFKNINDSLGHTIGDKVLMIAAKRFVRMLNPNDMVARIGGDEFAIILRNVKTTGKAQKVARRIYDSISQPFSLSGNSISISVNIGIAPCDAEYNTPEEVLRDADIAMHYAKEKEDGVAIFTKELRYRFLERIRTENDLRHAIDRGELSMNYQPLVDLQDGHLLGFEALLRWNHSELGNVPPNKFIPIAEDSGLIIPITIWILKETCTRLARWQKIGPAYKDMIVSVNISGKHLMHGDLIADVEHALEMSKLSPSSLKLEITESVAMENADHTINVLNRLKQLGVKLSIDDFGTGYSSLSILHRLPFDSLKIDRSFVYSVGENGENSEILQTIISLAKNLKMRVIAEGIETETQLNLLQNLGCDYGQGYLLARPQNADAAEKLLYESKTWLPVPLMRVDEPTQESIADANLPVF